MDRSGFSSSFEDLSMDEDIPMIFLGTTNSMMSGFPPATSADIDSVLDFIFSEDSDSSASSDTTISEEPRGVQSTSTAVGVDNAIQSFSVTERNSTQQANDEADVLQRLNRQIKKVEKEVEDLRRSISGLCQQ